VLERREQILALPEPERTVRLHFLDRAWADYLAYLAHLRESVPLRTLSGKSPVLQFNADATATFTDLIRTAEKIADEVLATRSDLVEAVDLEFGKPSATWTYVVQDNPFGSPFERFLAGVGRKLFGITDEP
jgi:preprotein translocase subunit SecA